MIAMFPDRTTHLHHWVCGLIFCTFLSSPDLLTAALHGFCNAIMVEGGAHWGYDFVWKRKAWWQRRQRLMTKTEGKEDHKVSQEIKTVILGDDQGLGTGDVLIIL